MDYLLKKIDFKSLECFIEQVILKNFFSFMQGNYSKQPIEFKKVLLPKILIKMNKYFCYN